MANTCKTYCVLGFLVSTLQIWTDFIHTINLDRNAINTKNDDDNIRNINSTSHRPGIVLSFLYINSYSPRSREVNARTVSPTLMRKLWQGWVNLPEAVWLRQVGLGFPLSLATAFPKGQNLKKILKKGKGDCFPSCSQVRKWTVSFW